MKKQSELNNCKVLYEYQRLRNISISKAKQIRGNRFIFQESEGLIQEESVSTSKNGSKENDLVYKTHYRFLINLL